MTLTAGTNTINFGTLREGDANDDNFVTILDFSILAATFGTCEGDDERADFNGDGCITILDFSLLASNFGQSGHAQRAPMEPSRTSEVSVRLDAGEQQVDGAQVVRVNEPTAVRIQELAAPATAGWLWVVAPLAMMMLAGAFIMRGCYVSRAEGGNKTRD